MLEYNALKDYVDNSELRVIIDGVFNARMSSEIAKKFDEGRYDTYIKDYRECIEELQRIGIKYPANVKPVFYLYIVPDENFADLLHYPHAHAKKGGHPVPSFDINCLNHAFGINQSSIIDVKKIVLLTHIMNIHEFSHIVHLAFGNKALMFEEGFAELIPWYAIGYHVRSHLDAMKSMEKIYVADELLGKDGLSTDKPNLYPMCSFRPKYISAYLWIRSVVEQIRVKYNLSKSDAVQKFLELYGNSYNDKYWFVNELAQIIGMDADKLLYSTDYQINTLKQIEQEYMSVDEINIQKER